MGKLTILQWNIRSINKNRPYLEHIIAVHQPDVLVLQETFDKSETGITLSNYQEPIRIKYFKGESKGISTYVSKEYTQTEIEKTVKEEYETTTTKIENRVGKEFIITNIHRKEGNPKKFKELLEEILIKYDTENHIIAGDFNLQHPLWDNAFIDKRNYNRYLQESDQIANLLLDREVVILNNGQYTRHDDREDDRASSAIDLTIINKHASRHKSEWILLDDTTECDRGNSDHIPLVSIIGNNYTDTPPTQPTGYDYKKLDKNKLRKELMKINWEEIRALNGETLDKEINTVLIEAIEQSIKKKKIFKGKKQRKVPWWNKRCQEAVNNKKAACKAHQKCRNTVTKNKYREMRNECNKVIKEEKRNHWQEYVNNINLNANDSDTWKKIKNMEGGHSKSINIPTLIDQDRNKYTTNKDKANILGETYSKLSSDDNYSKTFLEIKNNYERDNNCNLTDKVENNEENINKAITLEELETALRHKKDTKEGIDQIRYTVYKELPTEGKTTVLKLLNYFWEKGEIPQQFKHSIIVPIAKPGKIPTDPKNYRPISLTTHLGKILETIINNRLMNHIETNGIFKDTQSGFRQKRQTMDHVVRMTNDIETCMKKNKINLAVCLDLQRAFDSIHRQGILLEIKKMGITGQMYNYIRCFLEDRTFQVRVEDQLSDSHIQENGTPQGSVISPTLFNILMNALPDIKINNPHVEIGTYADDIAIWLKPEICRSKKKRRRNHNQQDISKKTIEKAANEIITELEQRGFIVNLAKTQTIMFNGKSSNEEYDSLTINGQEIKFSKSIKYLGVTLDKKLNFNEHIDELLIRAQKSMYILQKLSGNKDWGSDSKTLRTTYLGLIRSKITYGEEVYHRASKTKLKQLDKLQNKALRIIAGVRKNAGDENQLGLMMNIEPLSIHRQISIANLSYRIRANPNNPAQKSLEPNNQITRNKIKNINAETKKILDEADIQETVQEYRPFREHWTKNAIPAQPETDMTDNLDNIVSVQSNNNSGYIKYRDQIYRYRYNNGISETTANLDLIDTALSIIAVEDESFTSPITIVTNNEKSLQNIILKENSDRPEILTNIYRNKEIINSKGNTVQIRLGTENDTLELAETNKEIPLTYKEIKPIIKRKIIQNIWKKQISENDKYQLILANEKLIYANLNRRERLLNNLRLGQFITRHNFPVCPYCEKDMTIKHIIEECVINEEDRKETKKHLNTFKIQFSTRNLLKPHQNQSVKNIIQNFINNINDSFKI